MSKKKLPRLVKPLLPFPVHPELWANPMLEEQRRKARYRYKRRKREARALELRAKDKDPKP